MTVKRPYMSTKGRFFERKAEDRMEQRNCFTSSLSTAIFAYFYYQCGDLMDVSAYWPELICKVGFVLSVLQFVMSAFKWLYTNDAQRPLFTFTAIQFRRLVIVLVIMCVWVYGLVTVGFLVSSAVALCVLAVYFEPEKSGTYIIRDVCVCTIFAALCYFTFKYLGIHFPRAILI